MMLAKQMHHGCRHEVVGSSSSSMSPAWTLKPSAHAVAQRDRQTPRARKKVRLA